MRTINSMIEFKQIIGRGTRLYDGKNDFMIYDFVKAHKQDKRKSEVRIKLRDGKERNTRHI